MPVIPSAQEIIGSCANELPVGVWVARAPRGEFVYANKGFEEIMGLPGLTDVAVGEYTEPYGIFTRDGTLYPENRLPFVRALEQRQVVMVDDLVIHRRDGERVYVRAYARPIFGADQGITHVVIAFIDITREVVAEQARDEFLSAASHELKTPLGALQIRLQALIDGARSGLIDSLESAMPALDACERQLQRVARLAEDLLDVSRVRAGRLELHEVEMDLAALVREVGTRLSDQARRAGSTLDLRAPASLKGRSDPSRIDQVITNLVENAIKYGEARPIEVALSQADGRAVITVRDQGIGIDGSDHERVFIAFERAVSRKNYPGLGLGLWIAKQIVERLGGTIEVASRKDEGATFRIFLPWP